MLLRTGFNCVFAQENDQAAQINEATLFFLKVNLVEAKNAC